MSEWGNLDYANNKPKYVGVSTGNNSSFGSYNVANVYSANVSRTQAVGTGVHPGWVLKTVGSGGRSGRTQYEVLVACNNVSSTGNTGTANTTSI